MHWTKVSILCLLGTFFLVANKVSAQENSPYSRYGLGDLNNNQNTVNRGMGGVSQAYSDPQSVNFVNPASYYSLVLTTFDVGIEAVQNLLLIRELSLVPALEHSLTCSWGFHW